MRKRFGYFGLFVLGIVTIEIVNLGLHLMNLPSDTAYYGGAVGSVVWLFIAFGIGEWLFSKLKKENHEKDTVAGGVVDLGSDGGLHDPNRAGSGGN